MGFAKIQNTANFKSSVSRLVLFLVIFIFLVAIIAIIYIQINNNLLNNNQWDAMEKHVKMVQNMAFLTESQTFAGNALNLGAWGGTNEVLYRTPITLKELSCKFSLAQNAYLNIIFNYKDGLYNSIRLASNPKYPNSLFIFDIQGSILYRTTIQVPLLTADAWHSLRLCADKSEVHLHLDNLDISLPVLLDQIPGKFGFRNGLNAATIDDIRAIDALTNVVYKESFNGIHLLRKALFFSFLLTIFFVFGFIFIGRLLATSFLKIFEYIFAIMLTLIAMGIVYGLFHFFILSKLYPVKPAIISDNVISQDYVTERTKEIVTRYSMLPADKGKRILFLGSSQTEGFGANSPSECYVTVLERLLNDSIKTDVPVHCINAGFGAFIIKLITIMYIDFLAELPFNVVIINLLCNDSLCGTSEDSYAADLELVSRMILDHGSKLIYVIEPSSPEYMPDEWRLAPVFRHVGDKLGIPVIDANAYLRERYDSGFIFWDVVHPTSYGHRLIAECLVGPISKALNQ